MKRFFIISSLFFLILLICIISLYKFTYLGSISALIDGYPIMDQSRKLIKVEKFAPSGWRSIFEISEPAKQAIVISEDWEFMIHKGVDFVQIESSLWEFFLYRKRLRGASTITQQVVKNIFLTHNRSFERKIVEFVGALIMDFFLTKDKILEIYLNVIQFGDKLYGIDYASLFYFNKSPIDLTAREGAFLAMLLPNPSRYSQSFRDKELSSYAISIVDQTLNKLYKAHILSEDELKVSLDERFGWEKEKKLKFIQKKGEAFSFPSYQFDIIDSN